MWELKVITDWTVTATCLELTQWFVLDDIYNTLYSNQRSNDERSKRAQVSKRKVWEKLLIGLAFAILLVIIILCPIFIFSSVNPVM